MTVFAGAYCLDPHQEVPPTLKAALQTHLRSVQDARGHWHLHDRPQIFLAKWDSGAFHETAWALDPDGAVSTLVGDPLLTAPGERMDRGLQLSRLVHGSGFNTAALAQTRGAFSVVHYENAGHRLHLATDMVGLRSVYYTVQNGVFIFASALRILESIGWIQKTPSTVGMVEHSIFGFPLAERTPYEGIFLLRECQTVQVDGQGVHLDSYYDWTTAVPSASTPETAAQAIYDAFQEAIHIRAGGDRNVYAFLSGGMDSRAIVGSLLHQGCQVEALNFSPDASQDQAYARALAEVAGPQCHLHCLDRDNDPNFSLMAWRIKTRLEKATDTHVDRPAFLWSGDGGSVGLGHVYMDEAMLDWADKGDLPAAVAQFFALNRLALPWGVLRATARQALPQMVADHVLAEVNRYPRADQGRRLYLFLLFNDQRRHLFKHFETIDQHGLEFLLPFYDTRFLQLVADTPARWGVLHKLYALWFEHLPAFTRACPWQTYPGHVPCPVAGDQTLSYQWASRTEVFKSGFATRLDFARRLCSAAWHPSVPRYFSKTRLVLAATLHALGLRDSRHVLACLHTFQQQNARVPTPST